MLPYHCVGMIDVFLLYFVPVSTVFNSMFIISLFFFFFFFLGGGGLSSNLQQSDEFEQIIAGIELKTLFKSWKVFQNKKPTINDWTAGLYSDSWKEKRYQSKN